jgi:hypothetical protein
MCVLCHPFLIIPFSFGISFVGVAKMMGLDC